MDRVARRWTSIGRDGDGVGLLEGRGGGGRGDGERGRLVWDCRPFWGRLKQKINLTWGR